MSQRLDSLNGKKASSTPSKPSLKFKPKVVARKTKEERDKDAPVVKQETSRNSSNRGRGSTRGRGRGGGGRANYAGTSLVTAGPLAQGTVSLGVSTNSMGFKVHRESGPSVSPTPEFLSNLKLKDPSQLQRSYSPESQGEEADDDDENENDVTRINMNREYRFADEETVLFPVRPTRKESTPTILLSRESTVDPYSREPSAPPVPPESGEIKVKQEDDINTFNFLGTQYSTLEPVIPLSRDPSDETSKLLSDHNLILKLVTKQLKTLSTEEEEHQSPQHSEDYILLQMPKLLPQFEPPQPKPQPPHDEHVIVKQEEKPSDVEEKQQQHEDQKPKKKSKQKGKLATDVSTLSGQIGQLNIHKSGKISVTMGDGIMFNVSKGTQSQFLQELCMIELGPDPSSSEADVEMLDENGVKVIGKTLRLGSITDKVILTPNFS
ncbi:RNA polymerase III subunit C53 [Scheffersomyces spartinae]|uniref:RNA polymerase III subunit C53 n=1 Tax=Scheffersomyces spartinae TaxID=45513 RepID=A0A9P8AKH1_9ASCO|nr:RNA polymerase III subunit C53 [Scheffersomyces spartinae]KAG7195843.1 RNA polymerase III subunit C53 [Scheffersomyces spartinae]